MKYNGWNFIDNKGTFELDNPHKRNYLYFPLANDGGMMSAITPTLHGDIKIGQNTFFSTPVSSEDLHNSKSNRNFWANIHGKGIWSAVGVSSQQTANIFSKCETENVKLQAGFLWHRVIRRNVSYGIEAEVTNFVPVEDKQLELMKIKLTNKGNDSYTVTPTAAIPVYGRSADNIRDHRHVTSLLNRVSVVREGIEVKPAMTFDERGHRLNTISYNVYGADGHGNPPVGCIPLLEDFIGEGGCLEWPETVICNKSRLMAEGDSAEGYEAIGALRFADCLLKPEESITYILVMSISDDKTPKSSLIEYLSENSFDSAFEKNKESWEMKLQKLVFKCNDEKFDLWMKWVSLQPELRRIYGCSFLPHHDYGKGGRGWRDLWQDCLALILMDSDSVRPLLLNNFGGVRLDGTNATIIGTKPGEFIADRNNISRVWSDHGVWPFFTTLLYINQSGDSDFLFQNQTYFKDRLIMRSTEIDTEWSPCYGSKQKNEDGSIYEGTILEHILIQNLAAFFNTGVHNNIRLENADWNDAFDMAPQNGETVAFTAFYAGNLRDLSKLLVEIRKSGSVSEVELGAKVCILLDTLNEGIDYNRTEDKQKLLKKYCETCRHSVSGKKVPVSINRLIYDLDKKAMWLTRQVQDNEWISSREGYEWFNGYYDNSGKRVEGDNANGVRMTLTGQVFPVMMGISTQEQTVKAISAVNRYLFDKKLGGYRLNTNFREVKLDLGRCFGFAFGHKENGSVFIHMAVMYAFALYRRGAVSEGFEVLESLYRMSTDFEKAGIYPGIPEYFNEKGRGMYHYLTGSASWLLLLMLTEVYGIRGKTGNLVIDPKLKSRQFDPSGRAAVKTVFAGKALEIIFINKSFLDYGSYSVREITIDGKAAEFSFSEKAAVLERGKVSCLEPEKVYRVEVILM
ncbi:MAG TPA: cellobiose phosphorylase [Ruminiclostridium sp.]|nr:cellobiose phosphorylase [Ruminiclostridium sp.]